MNFRKKQVKNFKFNASYCLKFFKQFFLKEIILLASPNPWRKRATEDNARNSKKIVNYGLISFDSLSNFIIKAIIFL